VDLKYDPTIVNTPTATLKDLFLKYLTTFFKIYKGYVVAQLVEALRYNPEGRGFDSPMMSLEFFIGINLWPWG
jgi:hypothetical protein